MVTASVCLRYVPVNEMVPRACAKVEVPPVIRALPENETLVAVALPAHACALLAASFSVPRVPLRTAVPLKTRHVLLVKTPLPEPFRVPCPIVPRPEAVTLPEALVPLTVPDPCPVYEAVKARCTAGSATGAPTAATVATAMSAARQRSHPMRRALV